MLLDLKALIVVLALSGLVFALGKRTALHFMEESDFKRRRNTWLFLSTVAFLSPNVWLFSLLAVPVLYWAGRKDTNPLALFLLLMNVIPSIPVQIPTNGLHIKQLFQIDIFRLLSLFVLLPAAWRLWRSKDSDRRRGVESTDLLLLVYGVLQVLLYVSPDPTQTNNVVLHSSFTNSLREAFLFVVDVYVVYYVASRSCSSRRVIVDAMAAFCLACTIMASVAAFEALKHWRLYADLYTLWGGHDTGKAYIYRAGLLRAESSSGNALVLGYLLAIAFGFWLYLQSQLPRLAPRVGIKVVLWAGLIAAISRGPWLGAILVYFAYATFRPGGASRLIKAGLVFLVIGGVVLATPLGERIRQALPGTGGSEASSSLEYRERVLERSWELIQAHPLLGDQLALSQLQDLRQGQGIIDLVNTYVQVTVFYGFFGLAIFLAFMLSILIKARAAARKAPPFSPDAPLLGAGLAACIVGALFILADCSFVLACPIMFYALAGIATGYIRLSELPRTDATVGAVSGPSPEPT